MTINDVCAFIVKCSDSDRDAIVRALKSRRAINNSVAVCSFSPGDVVTFQGRNGMVTGKVLKVNRTTVTVQENADSCSARRGYDEKVGMVWRVAAAALRKGCDSV
jgi:hypothetical protein